MSKLVNYCFFFQFFKLFWVFFCKLVIIRGLIILDPLNISYIVQWICFSFQLHMRFLSFEYSKNSKGYNLTYHFETILSLRFQTWPYIVHNTYKWYTIRICNKIGVLTKLDQWSIWSNWEESLSILNWPSLAQLVKILRALVKIYSTWEYTLIKKTFPEASILFTNTTPKPPRNYPKLF